MKNDAIICLIVTIAIIAAIAISAWVFDIDTKTPLSVFGTGVAVLLPVYVLHRMRSNKKEHAAKYGVEKVVAQSVESLEEVEELVEGSIEGFKGFGWYIKDCAKEDEEKELKSYKKDIKKGYEGAEEFLEWYKEWLKDMRRNKLDMASDYGSEIRYLYTVLKKIQSIRYSLTGFSIYGTGVQENG